MRKIVNIIAILALLELIVYCSLWLLTTINLLPEYEKPLAAAVIFLILCYCFCFSDDKSKYIVKPQKGLLDLVNLISLRRQK